VARGEPELLQYLGTMECLEAASVPAFLRLADELRQHGAPAALVARAEQAAADEVGHAAGFAHLRAERGAPSAASPVEVPQAPRSLEALAVENAVEGCVRETFGALVAGYQARTAGDEALRRIMTRVAAEELLHAELAELGALQLDERHGLRGDAEALEDGEGRHQAGGGRDREVQLHAHGDGVARGGGGEIGRQEQAEHGGGG